jgi:coenzyme F420-reducing hydrogenase delta subunit
MIRVMCSGRVDLEFILRAFSRRADGVLIGGCRLNECNYITHGNYDALGNVHLCKKIMGHIGLDPERLRIEFMSSSDGLRLAEVTNDFVRQVKEIGPLGQSEGIGAEELKLKLEAATQLVPYVKLVEREKLRAPIKSEAEYHRFFTSEEARRLIDELIMEKLSISQILLHLRKKPLSTAEIAGLLGLAPSEVARHMKSSSRQGLVRYDVDRKCYVLAQGGAA